MAEEIRPIAAAIRDAFGAATPNHKVTDLVEALDRHGLALIPKRLLEQLTTRADTFSRSC